MTDKPTFDLMTVIAKAFRIGFYFPRAWRNDPERPISGGEAWEWYQAHNFNSDWGSELFRLRQQSGVQEPPPIITDDELILALAFNIGQPLPDNDQIAKYQDALSKLKASLKSGSQETSPDGDVCLT